MNYWKEALNGFLSSLLAPLVVLAALSLVGLFFCFITSFGYFSWAYFELLFFVSSIAFISTAIVSIAVWVPAYCLFRTVGIANIFFIFILGAVSGYGFSMWTGLTFGYGILGTFYGALSSMYFWHGTSKYKKKNDFAMQNDQVIDESTS